MRLESKLLDGAERVAAIVRYERAVTKINTLYDKESSSSVELHICESRELHICESRDDACVRKSAPKSAPKFAFRNYLALPHERVVQINTFTQPNKPHITIQQT